MDKEQRTERDKNIDKHFEKAALKIYARRNYEVKILKNYPYLKKNTTFWGSGRSGFSPND
jgi:hypothetical protein